MSLFENAAYQWRETFFVLFADDCRPSEAAVEQALTGLDARYEIADIRGTEDGMFESCTVYSPQDNAAMDITYTDGPEVQEQIEELKPKLTSIVDGDDEKQKLSRMSGCNARLDIFHFEQMSFDAEPEDEYMDPGSLLIVLERLAKLCDGVGVDPQSGAVL